MGTELIDSLSAARPGAFHSTMFQASATCSYYQYFDKCWMLECARLWHFEFGCAANPNRAKEGQRRCTTPFAKTLLQVQAKPVSVT